MIKVKKITLFAVVAISAIACKRETSLHTIQGNLKSDCSQAMVNAEVALKSLGGSINSETLIIGSAITNESGNFQFTYELEEDEEGTAELILLKESGYSTLISGITLGSNLQLKLFLTNLATVYINLDGSRQLSATDTLYYGISEFDAEFNKVQVNSGRIDTVQFEIPNTLSNQSERVLYFGIGRADFQKAKEAVSIEDSSYQHVPFQARGCFGVNEVDIELN